MLVRSTPPPPIVTYIPPATWAGSPVDLPTAKIHIRAGGSYDVPSAAAYTAEDTIIQSYLNAASRLVEDQLGRALLTQTWQAVFSLYDNELKFIITRGPMQSISLVEALILGVYTTVATSVYRVRNISRDDTYVRLNLNQTWPVADTDDAAYRFTFTLGYGAASNVPAPIIAAILLVTSGLYENREDMSIGTAGRNPAVASLLRPYMAPGY